MALIFDKNGNLIHEVVNKKIRHNEKNTFEIIESKKLKRSERIRKENIMLSREIQVDKYWCSICERFHKRKFRGKLNQTFVKHNSYAKEVSSSYVYNSNLMKSIRDYDIKKHKLTKGSKKQ